MRYCLHWCYVCYRTHTFGEGVVVKVPKSGEKNTSFGVYQNACCGVEIVISVGSEFPACPQHPNRLAEWTPIEIDIAEVIVKKKSQSESAA